MVEIPLHGAPSVFTVSFLPQPLTNLVETALTILAVLACANLLVISRLSVPSKSVNCAPEPMSSKTVVVVRFTRLIEQPQV